jgi:haloacetate dehalogenase
MDDLADLFPGFESHHIPTKAGNIFARSGGAGEPLILLHGFPETHVMWHRVAGELAKTHRVILPDLRGYGWSSVPKPDANHEIYSKRAMAADIIEVASSLGLTRFALAGHDRGGRVAYRLALDNPGRLSKLALLDITPTLHMWRGMDMKRALQVYHWLFLAQPTPLPETLIGKAPTEYLDHTLASWTAKKDLSAFDPRALAHYRAFFNDPSRLRATCEDYRAGATRDFEHDAADDAAGKTIDCPVHVLWGESGIPAQKDAETKGASPLAGWKGFAPNATGEAIASGHFLPEENSAATLAALQRFFG